MNKSKQLSGEEIVAKGATKASVSLPEIGLKDVKPNGSWLEQKQIQSSLDGRKHLIEVERIEKWGNISHAEWREELMLAEVTKQMGGYWQYLGHHSGKILYLYPEEALYLMEVNCLQLKYNEVTVSLQQAYSLLLRGQVSILQYKVYSSLSRLGYKIFRFSPHKAAYTEDKTNAETLVEDVVSNTECDNTNDDIEMSNNTQEVDENAAESSPHDDGNIETVNDEKHDVSETNIDTSDCNSEEVSIDKTNTENCLVEVNETAKLDDTGIQDNELAESNEPNNLTTNNPNESEIQNVETAGVSNNQSTCTNKEFNMNHKAKVLRKRYLRSQSGKDFHKYYDSIPDLLQKDTVTITVPTEHLPDRVTPIYASYEVNLNNVRTKKVNPQHTELNTYNTNERTEYSFHSSLATHQSFNNQTYFYTNVRFHRQPIFNQFQYFRPRQMFSFPYNVVFQRPFIRNTYFAPRFHFVPRQPAYVRPNNPICTAHDATNLPNNQSNAKNCRKRTRDSEQMLRLNTIKNLASKLKSKRLIDEFGLVNFLHSLIKIYNERYQMRIRLTSEFEIDDHENIVDTINLDDDEVAAKRPKTNENSQIDENFYKIQELASKMKDLEAKELATPRHRRALSNVVRTFNDSFNSDIYINESYDVIDRRHIVLDSSSDSDHVIKVTTKKEKKKNLVGKKLRNPFNLLKCLSEKSKQVAGCSKDSEADNNMNEDKPNRKYSEEMKRAFKSWLPKSNDFGRAEIAPKSLMVSRIVDSNKQVFLYDFMKNQSCKFVNWMDVKMSFLENIEFAAAMFHNDMISENGSEWNSIIKPEDCKNMPSVLNKLSIIPNNSDVSEDVCLRIDFDVYNRDVQNFKKTNVPKPHFRIVCVELRSGLPQGPDVAALASRHNDAPIVFAVVGEAISYLRICPTNLPMYIPEVESVNS